ncbi:MAG: TlpA disulfide reductase family protein [Bacteroidia bacterium]
MKFIQFLLVLGVLFSIQACSDKNKETGVIHGKFTNANGITVYLQRIVENGEENLDSTKTDGDGNFTLKNNANALDYYMVRTGPANVIYLVLKGGETIELSGDAKNIEHSYTVKGSEDSELLKELRQFEKNLGDSLNQVYATFREENPARKDSAGAVLQRCYSETMASFSKKFIDKHLTSIVSLSATKFLNQQTSIELMVKLENSLSKQFPENKYVQDYKALMSDLQKLPPGSEAPEIKLASPAGEQLALSSYRGKVVLIDFWASWCGPCRRENPNIVKIYEKYKNSGFEIFGVSLDENVEAWKAAIQKDGITWPQVSELKRWESKVVKDFGIEAIPYSVLIDQNGKIVAKGLRSDELDLKLMELLRKNS